MNHRLLLDKIDYDDHSITIGTETYRLNTAHFPTVSPQKPWALTDEEKLVVDKLQTSFLTSDKLQSHIRFMYSKGSIYLKHNGNLLFHASIPMNEDGSFKVVNLYGEKASGKTLMDKMDQWARESYFSGGNKTSGTDFLWYLWCNENSPLFGKDKMATFERYFIDDKKSHKEKYAPYFTMVTNENIALQVLTEFDLDPKESHIINGHVPVKTNAGESPIKANGRLLVIDGGFAKAYQSTTGIAGYTLIYNSYGLQLASHEPFESVDKAINEGIDIRSTTSVIEKVVDRKKVADTDIGERLRKQIYYLEMLIAAYRKGIVKEKL
jgi:fructose-1,6-bisphosphatase-3